MAKGAVAKTEITNKIFEVFPNAFMNGKELRIPWIEDGEEVQIKIALTCAKENVDHDGATVAAIAPKVDKPVEAIPPTEEEKKNIANLASLLGLI